MITTDTLKKVAALAKLSLDGEDLDKLAADFGGIVEFADAVAGADLSAMDLTEHDEDFPLREDVVIPSLPPEKILQNAGEARDGFFITRG
ncbi:MAG: aspartyl/glutamyl-tRNA amidotransferase subunit C [Oscillospiraceae bacterium]|jgi:aspartyl-tRNA(Asn)/glutamyl-tRNA(Gln) amidotransferase subunit C|nr:aspartyl/glutamyl-tRNA amidotransferase subunit C [Oscillospiraceae bacterium]